MDPGGIVVLAAGVVGGIVALAIAFSPKARLKRALARLPRLDVARVADGAMVKVLGQIGYQGDPLVSPLSGRRCAYYEITVMERRSAGKQSHWVAIIKESDSRDFLLRDGTGKALVRIAGAAGARRVVLHQDAHFSSGTFNDATPEIEAYLARHAKSSTGLLFNKSLHYAEGILEEGETVVVAGQGRWEADPDPDPGVAGAGYRDSPRRFVLTRGAQLELMVSDDPDVMGAPSGAGAA